MKVLGYALLILGAFIALLNAWLPVRYWILRRREQSRSCIPIIGGLLASCGMLLAGEAALRSVFWLPLLLDIGCVPMVFYALIKAMLHNRRKD